MNELGGEGPDNTYKMVCVSVRLTALIAGRFLQHWRENLCPNSRPRRQHQVGIDCIHSHSPDRRQVRVICMPTLYVSVRVWLCACLAGPSVCIYLNKSIRGQLLLLDDRLLVTSTAVPTKRFAKSFKAMQVKGCSVWCRPVDSPLPSQTAIRIVHTRDWLFSKYGQAGSGGDSGGSLPMAASNAPDSVAAVGA